MYKATEIQLSLVASKAKVTRLDFTLLVFSMFCPSGAFYYYVTEKGSNYEKTLLAVDKYAKDNNIPYRSAVKTLLSCKYM